MTDKEILLKALHIMYVMQHRARYKIHCVKMGNVYVSRIVDLDESFEVKPGKIPVEHEIYYKDESKIKSVINCLLGQEQRILNT